MDLTQLRTLSESLDPEFIPDPATRQAVFFLLNVGEHLLAENAALRTQVQQLKDEIAHLKGEQGKPKFPPNRPAPPAPDPASHSSESERRTRERRKPWKKRTQLDRILLDRTARLAFAPGALPADARFKGHEAVVLQDLVLRTDNVRFLRAKFYSPSQHRTFLAPLPPGYTGEFGPGLKTLARSLVYGCHLSQPLLQDFFQDAGILISKGQVARLVTEELEPFHAEQAAVLQAGLASSPWQHLDVTPTRVDGENHACHVLGNPLYSHYHTTRKQDRGSALAVLRGGAPPRYRLDETAFALLAEYRLAASVRRVLERFPRTRIGPKPSSPGSWTSGCPSWARSRASRWRTPPRLPPTGRTRTGPWCSA